MCTSNLGKDRITWQDLLLDSEAETGAASGCLSDSFKHSSKAEGAAEQLQGADGLLSLVHKYLDNNTVFIILFPYSTTGFTKWDSGSHWMWWPSSKYEKLSL